jgi:hypothetical protein
MSNHTRATPKAIEARARTVRELLDTTKYAIDSYQREYAWRERQVRELIDDLTGRFLDSYEDGHARHEVERYGHYFLGSVVLSHKRGDWYVVDGQQRLTTLTLFLIYLKSYQVRQARLGFLRATLCRNPLSCGYADTWLGINPLQRGSRFYVADPDNACPAVARRYA